MSNANLLNNRSVRFAAVLLVAVFLLLPAPSVRAADYCTCHYLTDSSTTRCYAVPGFRGADADCRNGCTGAYGEDLLFHEYSQNQDIVENCAIVNDAGASETQSHICACYLDQGKDCYYNTFQPSSTNPAAECQSGCQRTNPQRYASFQYARESATVSPVVQGCEAVGHRMSAEAPTEAPKKPFVTPILSVPIPDITFTPAAIREGKIVVNFLGEYIKGLYNYLIGISITIAIVMIMIGGLQYVLSAGTGDVKKAKERIKNAIVGLVLLLGVYVILFTVNPQLVIFPELGIDYVQNIRLNLDTTGEEGVGSATATLASLAEPCKRVLQDAKTKGTCAMEGSFGSPTGSGPLCSNHHWGSDGANYDYTKMTKLDYPAPWNTPIRAPFTGIVTYQLQTGTDNKCGNRIHLKGSGASITICHAKDFVDANGGYQQSRSVQKGDIIGHVGGNCCQGENPPGDWMAAQRGWCNKPGPVCDDPTRPETCSCQKIVQAGNTSGPHVHVTWYRGGDLLTCLAD